jgi:tRNA (cytidine/uridine-2'-O-)-methyltransferase
MKHLNARRAGVDFPWPGRPFNVVLVEPEIPPNTGNIARLCAATGTILHLVGPLGFHLDSRSLKRAGLDYWDAVQMVRHVNYEDFDCAVPAARRFFFSAKGTRLYSSVQYQPGDVLVFGSESKGLPDQILCGHADRVLAIPVRTDGVRSLNLATAVAIVLYEALRQCAERSRH